MDNPFDRSVYLAFDLVVNHGLNPWDIDLVQFSTLYLKRAQKEKLDLITAGRIIYMAWRVLRMQSDDLVVNMEKKPEVVENGFGWEDLPTGAWFESDDGYSYTNLVMKMPEAPLDEPLRRDAKRKVMLIELLDAFHQARKEAEEHQLLDRLRQEEKLRLAALARQSMIGAAHEDHLEEDVLSVWERIQQFPQTSIVLSSLFESNDPDERIKVFLSVLFLAYENKIQIHQQHFPYGKIYIKNLGYT